MPQPQPPHRRPWHASPLCRSPVVTTQTTAAEAVAGTMHALPINPQKILFLREKREEEEHPPRVSSPRAPPAIHHQPKHQRSVSPPASGRLSARVVEPSAGPEGANSGRRSSNRLASGVLLPEALLPEQESSLAPRNNAAYSAGTELCVEGEASLSLEVTAECVDAAVLAEVRQHRVGDPIPCAESGAALTQLLSPTSMRSSSRSRCHLLRSLAQESVLPPNPPSFFARPEFSYPEPEPTVPAQITAYQRQPPSAC